MRRVWQYAPGFCATMAGIGFARFSFTPVSALLVDHSVLTSQNITIIAAFMMAGYAVGAFIAVWFARYFGAVHTIRLCFIVIAVALAAEMTGVGFWAILAGRFIMTVCGAMLMVLGPSLVLAGTVPGQRAFAGGVIFSGIGAGIIVAGLVVAFLADFEVMVTGLSLSAIAVILAILGWGEWPQDHQAGTQVNSGHLSPALLALVVAYLFDALAYIPHTVFLSDYVSSELGYGAAGGGQIWAVLGAGAITGAAGSAWLRRLFGGQMSLELVLGAKALFIALAGLSGNVVIILISAFIVGALVPGVAMLVSARSGDMVAPDMVVWAWGILTGAFAVGQFAGATGLAFIYSLIGKYQPMFVLGGLLEATGLAVLIISFRFFNAKNKGNRQ